jgi:Ca2+-binding RTX toxin-like protein
LLTAQISGGTLFVNGTALSDNIDLKIIGNQLVVLIDTENFRQGFLMTAFRRVSIDCKAGDDTVTNEFEFTKPMTISGGAGNDRLTGGGGPDNIDGGDDNDVISGGDLDVLPASDTLIGGAGTDIADYTSRGRALKIDLDGNRDDGIVGEHDLVDATIEVVAGGSAADLIVSNLATGVTLYGNGGNDTLSSGAGNDRLSGGPGQDLIRPHAGDDTMLGGRQRDNMFGGAGTDTVDYSYEDRALVIAPDSQPDSGYTGEFDIIGADVENSWVADEPIRSPAAPGPTRWSATAGNDTIIGLSGDDTIRGGSGNDMMDGGDDADILDGGLGDDDFVGGTGLDTADYSNRSENLTIDVNDAADDGAAGELDNVHADVEIVESGSGRDSLLAASSGTQLEGGLNDDTLVGGVGNDTLIGGPDSIVGGQSDNDLLDGGSGADMMFGGRGTDFIDYSARTADVIAAINGSATSGEAGEG